MDQVVDNQFAQAVIEIALTLVSVLFTIGSGYAVSAIKAARDKNAFLKLALSDARIEQFTQDAIRIAEEKVAVEIKHGVARGATKASDGARKFAVAVTHVLEKVPGITRDEAERLVQANLSKVGAGAAAAIRDMAAAARN